VRLRYFRKGYNRVVIHFFEVLFAARYLDRRAEATEIEFLLGQASLSNGETAKSVFVPGRCFVLRLAHSGSFYIFHASLILIRLIHP
jgi:hypothetical protein